jgi:hypothetical protein
MQKAARTKSWQDSSAIHIETTMTLIDKSGNLKTRGLEKVRRDRSSIARNTQEEVLRLILGKRDIRLICCTLCTMLFGGR